MPEQNAEDTGSTSKDERGELAENEAPGIGREASSNQAEDAPQLEAQCKPQG